MKIHSLYILLTVFLFSQIGEARGRRWRSNSSFQAAQQQTLNSFSNLAQTWIDANTVYRFTKQYLYIKNKSSYAIRAHYWTSAHGWLFIRLAPGESDYARDLKGRAIAASYFQTKAESIDGNYVWSRRQITMGSYVARRMSAYTRTFQD